MKKQRMSDNKEQQHIRKTKMMPKHGCVLHEIQLMSLHLEREMCIALLIRSSPAKQTRSIRYSVFDTPVCDSVICYLQWVININKISLLA